MSEQNLTSKGKALENRVEQINTLMIGVVIVLLVGFAGTFVAAATMLVDSFNNKQATYQDLRDKVQEQNAKIDELTQTLQKSTTIPKTN